MIRMVFILLTCFNSFKQFLANIFGHKVFLNKHPEKIFRERPSSLHCLIDMFFFRCRFCCFFLASLCEFSFQISEHPVEPIIAKSQKIKMCLDTPDNFSKFALINVIKILDLLEYDVGIHTQEDNLFKEKLKFVN